jgi:magnesium and cobalt transporter
LFIFITPVYFILIGSSDIIKGMDRFKQILGRVRKKALGLFPANVKIETPLEEKKKIIAPASEDELVEMLKITDERILSSARKRSIAAMMSLDHLRVRDILVPRDEICFVFENDFLGPLMLDKLHKTGFIYFPVMSARDQIIGFINLSDLFNLKIKETDRAGSYLDRDIYFVRDTYSLKQALAAFLRTKAAFFMVVDGAENITGMLLSDDLISGIMGENVEDAFEGDSNISAVARRKA